MSGIYKGALELIGNTPLVEVENLEKELGLESKLLVKLEYFNPAGSVKDRIAKAMIEDAERNLKRRFRDYRTDFGKYRNRAGVDCRSQRLPADIDNAGDDERGKKKYPQSIWR